MSQGTTHGLMPDVTGLLLVANGWLSQSTFVTHAEGYFKMIMLLASSIATVLAIVDYCMKIRWKLQQAKRNKEQCLHLDKCANLKKTEWK